jgi:hypothetical protein
VHLFGGPGKIHMHLSLLIINFKLLNESTSLPSLSNLLSSSTLLYCCAVSRLTEGLKAGNDEPLAGGNDEDKAPIAATDDNKPLANDINGKYPKVIDNG